MMGERVEVTGAAMHVHETESVASLDAQRQMRPLALGVCAEDLGDASPRRSNMRGVEFQWQDAHPDVHTASAQHLARKPWKQARLAHGDQCSVSLWGVRGAGVRSRQHESASSVPTAMPTAVCRHTAWLCLPFVGRSCEAEAFPWGGERR